MTRSRTKKLAEEEKEEDEEAYDYASPLEPF
jgi:hypothetical protein